MLFSADAEVWWIDFDQEDAHSQVALLEWRTGAEVFESIVPRLDAIDTRSGSGPSTRDEAATIADHPGVGTGVFERGTRRLEELRLTESLRAGYRLSPRWRDVHAHVETL